MSRLVQRPVTVEEAPGGGGAPTAVRLWDGRLLPVLAVLDSWREWFGVLEGEPERDVWRVETAMGPAELHRLGGGAGGGEDGRRRPAWLFHAWLD